MNKTNLESVRNLTGFNSIFSDSAFNFSARIISNIFYFLFITFIIKILGEERYGEYSIFLMIAQFIYIGFLVWLQSGLMRYGREEFTSTHKINTIFTAHLIVLIPLIFLLILNIFIFQEYILNYLKFDTVFIYIIILYFLTNYITEMLYYSLQAIGEIKIMSIAQTFEKTTPVLIILILYYVFGISKLSVVVAVILCGQLLSQIFILTKIKLNYFFPLKFDKKILKKYIKYSIPIFWGSLASYFITWIDVGIIKNNLSIEKVGHFFYCQQIFNGLNQLNIVFVTILLPIIITLILKNRNDLLIKIIENFTPVLSIIAAVLINVMWLTLYFVLSIIFKGNIFEISLTLQILMFTFLISINQCVMAAYITGYELTFIYSLNSIAGLSLKILLSLFLIRKTGIIGAGAASFLSVLFSIWFYNLFLKKKIEFKNNYFFIGILILQIIIYYLLKNIFISFASNIIILFIYLKYFKIFAAEKIQIIYEINMPDIIKKSCRIVSKMLG